MRELSANGSVLEDRAAVLLETISGRTVWGLTSYDPDVVRGGKRRRFGRYDLPHRVGEVVSGSPRILCLGPADWLLVSSGSDDSPIDGSPAADASGVGWVRTDLSAGHAVLKIAGVGAGRILRQGCGLDLDPVVFTPGQCARTRFAQVPVVIDFVQSPNHYELYVARSFGTYLYDWLRDASGMSSD